ncbi:MAG TPA: cell division protein ZapB [Vicinamibacterales bacterium]|nr:cell division protein ZapB [Vicinamibacterales bacterium]
MAKTAVRGLDLESIDRLGEKVTQLIGVIERLRTEQGRLIEENGRLTREIEALERRLAEAEGSSTELNALREERDVIRTRVADMLEQLEALHL